MKITFRWYGKNDPIPLSYIRQIPNMSGVVSAIYDIPVGDIWPEKKIKDLKEKVEKYNLELEVIESVPVHEDIKLGEREKDKYIENYKQNIKNLGKFGIKVICYNFMPVFDWTRSSLKKKLLDGSTTLTYESKIIEKMDPKTGELDLPGWDISYGEGGLGNLMDKYREKSKEDIWKNFEYFIKAIIPTAEKANVKMAIHPDDPPWSIFGIPRIVKDRDALERLTTIVDSPYNGLTLCSGSLGSSQQNNIIEIIKEFGSKDKIHFAHLRNVKLKENDSFEEAGHWSKSGSLDTVEILKAYHEVGFDGYIRPDHGRMIWGEQGKPGYGLYDRALGAAYINGIWETLEKTT